VTLALLDPPLLVILPVIHHFQDVHLLRFAEHSGDEAKSVVANVEYDTATNDVRRTESLLHLAKVRPERMLGQLVPGVEVAIGDAAVLGPSIYEIGLETAISETYLAQ
jgi:hypothetical protein